MAHTAPVIMNISVKICVIQYYSISKFTKLTLKEVDAKVK